MRCIWVAVTHSRGVLWLGLVPGPEHFQLSSTLRKGSGLSGAWPGDWPSAPSHQGHGGGASLPGATSVNGEHVTPGIQTPRLYHPSWEKNRASPCLWGANPQRHSSVRVLQLDGLSSVYPLPCPHSRGRGSWPVLVPDSPTHTPSCD